MKHNILLTVVTVADHATDIYPYLTDAIPIVTLCAETYEIIIIANGFNSEDVNLAKQMMGKFSRVRILFLAGKFPLDVAFMAGIENGIGDYLIAMECHYDPPNIIPMLLEKAAASTDIIIASNGYARYKSLWQRLIAKMYHHLLQRIHRQHEPMDPSYFTCFSRKSLTILSQFKNTVRNYRFLRFTLGFSRTKIIYKNKTKNKHFKPYSTPTRIHLESFFSYSLFPLKFFSTLAFLLGATSFSYVLFAFFSWIFNSHVASGWTSISMIYGTMSGSLFFLLGIYGWYLSILHKEVKGVAPFQITEEITSGSAFLYLDKKNIV